MLRCLSLALVASLGLLIASPGQAAPITYTVTLSGANEAPANGSPGVGSGTITIDTALHTLDLNFSFSGLTGTTTAAHIHCCTAAPGTGTTLVATQIPSFTGFPLGVTGGSYAHQFDLTQLASYNTVFVTVNGGTAALAEAALAAGLAARTAYLNIHTTTFPGGEIRSFADVPAPEPATLSLLLAGVAGIALRRRRR